MIVMASTSVDFNLGLVVGSRVPLAAVRPRQGAALLAPPMMGFKRSAKVVVESSSDSINTIRTRSSRLQGWGRPLEQNDAVAELSCISPCNAVPPHRFFISIRLRSGDCRRVTSRACSVDRPVQVWNSRNSRVLRPATFTAQEQSSARDRDFPHRDSPVPETVPANTAFRLWPPGRRERSDSPGRSRHSSSTGYGVAQMEWHRLARGFRGIGRGGLVGGLDEVRLSCLAR